MTRLTRSSYVKIALIVALALLLFAVAGAGSMRGCSQGIYLGGGTEMGNASVDAKSERNLSVSWAAGSVDISVVDDGALNRKNMTAAEAEIVRITTEMLAGEQAR